MTVLDLVLCVYDTTYNLVGTNETNDLCSTIRFITDRFATCQCPVAAMIVSVSSFQISAFLLTEQCEEGRPSKENCYGRRSIHHRDQESDDISDNSS